MRHALLIVLAGVAAALPAVNRPFPFVAPPSVVALMGMIMSNSVILIDQIEQERARGVPTWAAVVEVAVRRVRPLILTDAAAVLATIPLSRSVFRGADGGRDHGRADRRDGADAAAAAGDVRGPVSRQIDGAGAGRCERLKSAVRRKAKLKSRGHTGTPPSC